MGSAWLEASRTQWLCVFSCWVKLRLRREQIWQCAAAKNVISILPQESTASTWEATAYHGHTLVRQMSNTNILISQACTPNSSLLWLGYVYRMVGRILKDIFCGELAAGKRITDRPHPRLVNVCKRNMRAFHIDMESWACLEADHTRWRRTLNQTLQSGDEKLMKVGGRGRQEGTQKKEQQPH